MFSGPVILRRGIELSFAIEEIRKKSKVIPVVVCIEDVDWSYDQISEFLNFINSNNVYIVYVYTELPNFIYEFMIKNTNRYKDTDLY